MEYPNWFEPYAKRCFEKYLLPFVGKSGLRFLQIGVYTGDASAWLLDNVLTGYGSILHDVDTWEGSDEPEHESFDWSEIERIYDDRAVARLGQRRASWEKFRGSSRDFFGSGRFDTECFDFVYVDGDHTPSGVLSDAVHSFELLNPGGLLAFDDYRWLPHGGRMGPGLAVDAFRSVYDEHLELIHLGAQAWFRKIA